MTDLESGTDPESEVDLEDAFAEHGLFAWLDLEIERVDPGHATFVLPFDEKFANVSSGTVHGGITATVIDTASGSHSGRRSTTRSRSG